MTEILPIRVQNFLHIFFYQLLTEKKKKMALANNEDTVGKLAIEN